MGFLKDLKKIKDTVVNEIEQIQADNPIDLDKLAELAKASRVKKPAKATAATEPAPHPQEEPLKEKVAKFQDDQALFQHFDDIISRNYAGYEVRRNVPAAELDPDCHPACTPVQFLFCKEGVPSLAVVLVRENTYRGMNVLGTKKICEAKGIDYLRFFREYDNEEDYVVDRINRYL